MFSRNNVRIFANIDFLPVGEFQQACYLPGQRAQLSLKDTQNETRVRPSAIPLSSVCIRRCGKYEIKQRSANTNLCYLQDRLPRQQWDARCQIRNFLFSRYITLSVPVITTARQRDSIFFLPFCVVSYSQYLSSSLCARHPPTLPCITLIRPDL